MTATLPAAAEQASTHSIEVPNRQWVVLHGAITEQQLLASAYHVAAAHGQPGTVRAGAGQLAVGESDRPLVRVRWRPATSRCPDTLARPRCPEPTTEVLIVADDATGSQAVAQLEALLRAVTDAYSPAELDALVSSMPLLERYSRPDGELDDWAVIFRDHYLDASARSPGWSATGTAPSRAHLRRRWSGRRRTGGRTAPAACDSDWDRAYRSMVHVRRDRWRPTW